MATAFLSDLTKTETKLIQQAADSATRGVSVVRKSGTDSRAASALRNLVLYGYLSDKQVVFEKDVRRGRINHFTITTAFLTPLGSELLKNKAV